MEWGPVILSFELALVTTVLLLLISLPLAFWLADLRSIARPVLEALISLPLVLPPTVLGFYLLISLSPGSSLGAWLNEYLGLRLVFSFEGLVFASMIYSLPFMVQPLLSGMNALPESLREASYVLGKSVWTTRFKILLPNLRNAVLTGMVLTFAHTIGEFGVVLMIGGNIPDKTRVASIAIYDEVEALNYDAANAYSLLLIGLCFIILLFVYLLNRNEIKLFRS